MDKMLAFSILSSSPSDIAAAGGAFSTLLSWRSGGAGKQQQVEKQAPKKQEGEKAEQGPRRPARARFAPEFDGINCFESIVPY